MSNAEIRVLFLGDEGVGKTSIIHTIVMESFPKEPTKLFKQVIISPELYLLPNNTNTKLIDSDASED
jgi:GTPase SAR1 family protein